IILLTTTVQSLINEVKILKADKSTTPKDLLVHVIDNNNQTTYKNELNETSKNTNTINISENNKTTKAPEEANKTNKTNKLLELLKLFTIL
ncbi:28365_t:CDS:1, partial [Racocetra persica]